MNNDFQDDSLGKIVEKRVDKVVVMAKEEKSDILEEFSNYVGQLKRQYVVNK